MDGEKERTGNKDGGKIKVNGRTVVRRNTKEIIREGKRGEKGMKGRRIRGKTKQDLRWNYDEK